MRNVNRRYNKRHSNIFISHIQNNLREYTIASIIFIIGILLGIVFVNNLNDAQGNEISTYITTSINTLKENSDINNITILKESAQTNILLVILLWLLGSTVIGLLLVYLIVAFKGFCFGYAISAIVYSLETGKAVILLISTMLLKNIIAIPCTIALAVSGMKLYKSIMQDRRKENIKLEVIRHTIFAIFILILLIASSFVEAYLSQGIFKYCLKYL